MAASLTLESIIKNYIIERGDDIEINYQRYLNIIISGLQELDLDVSGLPKFLKVVADSHSTIPIPNDSLQLIAVHFASNGKWITAARDFNTSVSSQYECGVPNVENTSISIQDIPGDNNVVETESNHYSFGQNTGAYFNVSLANPFTFIENERMGVVQLSTNFPSNVVLEYLPKRESVNGGYVVKPQMREPLLAWLRYASVRSKPNYPQGTIRELKHQFFNTKQELSMRLNSFTIEDFKHAFMKNQYATAKF